MTRLQFLEFLFQLFYFVLYVLLSRIDGCVSNWWLTFCSLWAISIVFNWGPSLSSLECVHDHIYKLLIISQGSKVVYGRESLINLAILLQMENASIKGFVFGQQIRYFFELIVFSRPILGVTCPFQIFDFKWLDIWCDMSVLIFSLEHCFFVNFPNVGIHDFGNLF